MESGIHKKGTGRKIGETLAAIVLGLMMLSATRNCSNRLATDTSEKCAVDIQTLSFNQNIASVLYDIELDIIDQHKAQLRKEASSDKLTFQLPSFWRVLPKTEYGAGYVNGEEIIFSSMMEEQFGIEWSVMVTTLETSNSQTLNSISEVANTEIYCGLAQALGTTREEQEEELQIANPNVGLSLSEPISLKRISNRFFINRKTVYTLNREQYVNGNSILTQWIFTTLHDNQYVKLYISAYSDQAVTQRDDFVKTIASTLKISN